MASFLHFLEWTMNRLIKFCFIACLTLAFNAHSEQTLGGQYKELGPWQVHYIAFPSTFIQPQIAKAYELERSGYKGIVNISVLKKRFREHSSKGNVIWHS